MFVSKIVRFVVVFVAMVSSFLGAQVPASAKVDCATMLGLKQPQIGYIVQGECQGTLVLMDTGQSVKFMKDGNYVFSLTYRGLLHGDPMLTNDEYTWIAPIGSWLKRSAMDKYPFAYPLHIYDTFVLLFVPTDSGYTHEPISVANPLTSYIQTMSQVRETGVLTLSYFQQQVCKVSEYGKVENLVTSITPDWIELDESSNMAIGSEVVVDGMQYGYLVMTNVSRISRFESSALFFKTNLSQTCVEYRRR